MERLLPHSGLAEAGVSSEAMMEGAAAATLLAPPYCEHLVTALSAAVADAADPTADQPPPHLNHYTVFACTWHATSLAKLPDADIANCCRLADYLMLDEACLSCLEDVVVQRQARSGVINELLPPGVSADNVYHRSLQLVDAIDSDYRLIRWSEDAEREALVRVALGMAVPSASNPASMAAAVTWGHMAAVLLALTQPPEGPGGVGAVEVKVTGRSACWRAASGGHLPMLKLLRELGFPWGREVVLRATLNGRDDIAIWALEHGAPVHKRWLVSAARWNRLRVLQWADAHSRLPDSDIPAAREAAARGNHTEVGAWLDEIALLRQAACLAKLTL
jgi:hypothetical protein